MEKKTIVISAVNLVEAGTLAILRDCLEYLSVFSAKEDYRVVALVYSKELAYFPNIEYIETKWPKKRWTNRLWFEYVSMKKISEKLSPVFLWFSLHDTSPSVHAERRAVYCHNSYSFYKWKIHDLVFAPKIALFALFTKSIYSTNINKNRYLVVQQEWFRNAMSKMFGIAYSSIIVAKPSKNAMECVENHKTADSFSFIFAGSPNSHKNFEIICKAAEKLEEKGIVNFKIYITVSGQENKYANWLYNNWKHVESLEFIGFQSKSDLTSLYEATHCLIFPSKVESWGLPISEYANYNKPMLLADLPYAHETAAGAQYVSYFDPDSVDELVNKMKNLISGNLGDFKNQPAIAYSEPYATNWEELFKLLLTDKK